MSRYGSDVTELVLQKDCFGFQGVLNNDFGYEDKVNCTALSEMRNKDCHLCKFYKTKEQFEHEVEKSKKKIVLGK